MLSVQSIIICRLAPSNLLLQLQGQRLTELWYQAGAFLLLRWFLAHKTHEQEQNESSSWQAKALRLSMTQKGKGSKTGQK